MIETVLFVPTYRSYGLAMVRYLVLEVTPTLEPFENGCGISRRVVRAGWPHLRDAQGLWANNERLGPAGSSFAAPACSGQLRLPVLLY